MKPIIGTAEAPAPQGTYAPAVAARGEMIVISGQTPRREGGTLCRGTTLLREAMLDRKKTV